MSEFIAPIVERHRTKLHFLLPGALLAGSYAFQGYPLAATTTTTALGALGLLDQRINSQNPNAMGALGLALLLSTAPLSIYRAWQTVGVDRFVNLANGVVGAGLVGWTLYSTYRRGFLPTYPPHRKPIIYGLCPALFFGLYQTGLLPSHFASVGLGAALWSPAISSRQKGDRSTESALALAYGTSLAAIPFALFGIAQSGNWGDRLLFAQTALLYAAPALFIFSSELKKRSAQEASYDLVDPYEERSEEKLSSWESAKQVVKSRFAPIEGLERLHALGHFLLPSLILLEGVAFQNYPLTAMAATTGLAVAAIAPHPLPDNPAIPVAMSAVFSVAGVALYRSWSSWNDKGLALFGNTSFALGTSLIGGVYAFMGCKLAYDMDKEGQFQLRNHRTATLSHLLGLFLPTLCFAIHKIAPPAYAAVGLGATSWGALLFSKRYSDEERDELHIESFALGVALAALPLSIAGLFQSSGWGDRLLFTGGALLQASSFVPLAIEIRKGGR